ncbi:orotate phosphoribosyltransferase [bacterium]|nr:orotate phosphoribosyltransferase [bacterium]
MIARQVAEILLKVNAVKLNVKEPFTYTSGLISPIYTDNRVLISYPEERSVIVGGFIDLIKERGLKPEFLAGTATAGIPWAAFVAERMNLPMVYVRSKPKEHGAGKQIEGMLPEGKTVLIIEDLVSTGGSSLNSVESIRGEGKGIVHEVLAIFSYGMEESETAFRNASTALSTLTNVEVLLEVAKEKNYITEEEANEVKRFISNPPAWKK